MLLQQQISGRKWQEISLAAPARDMRVLIFYSWKPGDEIMPKVPRWENCEIASVFRLKGFSFVFLSYLSLSFLKYTLKKINKNVSVCHNSKLHVNSAAWPSRHTWSHCGLWREKLHVSHWSLNRRDLAPSGTFSFVTWNLRAAQFCLIINDGFTHNAPWHRCVPLTRNDAFF